MNRNLDTLHAAYEELPTLEQGNRLASHLLGMLSTMVDPAEWDRCVEVSRVFAAGTYVNEQR